MKIPVIPNNILDEMITWLNAEIGVEHKDWTFGLYFGEGDRLKEVTDKFSFNREEDKVKFILKWL